LRYRRGGLGKTPEYYRAKLGNLRYAFWGDSPVRCTLCWATCSLTKTLAEKIDTTANTPKFYTQLNLWQLTKNTTYRNAKQPKANSDRPKTNCFKNLLAK
jgi:hypothetical protein